METLAFLTIVFGVLGFVHAGPSTVPCAVPLSPEHGQAFLYQEGQVVKYACEPGYALVGKEIVRCIDGQWEDPNPVCAEIGGEGISEEQSNADAPVPPARPLFSWGSDNELDNEQEVNSTEEEMALSDEARVRLLLYPRRRVVTRVQTARLQSAAELEEEEKKRSQEKSDSKTSTTIHLGAPPSVLYVRRTVIPGKSETARKALEEQTASLHMTVENDNDVQFISLPRSAVSLSDKGVQAEQDLRQLYWHYYNYPRAASYLQYHNGYPVMMSLTESQLAWINSLHPELRDQYLKDLYGVRAPETVEGQRAQALLQSYEDAYNYVYHVPYGRRPVSSIVDNRASTFDYTCNQAGWPVIPAPSLPNMHIARYDSRKNIHEPHNYYLATVYQCDPGYYMLDPRFAELYCSKGQWVGLSPVCVANP